MKKLNKAQQAEHERIEVALDEARTKVNEAREALVQRLKLAIEGWGPALDEAISAWKGLVEDADAFSNDIVEKMDEYAGERSESWSEGEAGSSFESWKGEWEGFSGDQGEETALELIFQEVREALDTEGGLPDAIPTMDDVCDAWSSLPVEVG